MNDRDIKISGFVLTTNSIDNQFPFIESIKSWLKVLDELIVIDGGSTDGTVEAINKLNDDRIRIIQDKETKWEKDWSYSRMGNNFDRGLQECTGDWVIKFDADYILHEKGIKNFRKECFNASNRTKLTLAFTRANFIVSDRYYVKSKKTLGVNKTLAKELNINLHYGLDLKGWGWGFDFINGEFKENGIHFGKMLRESGNSFISSLIVMNYDYIFIDEGVAKMSRHRHYLAVIRQKNFKYEKAEGIVAEYTIKEVTNKPEIPWDAYKFQCQNNLKFKVQIPITLDKQPKIIQKRLKKIRKNQQGYDLWGWATEVGVSKNNYYGK